MKFFEKKFYKYLFGLMLTLMLTVCFGLNFTTKAAEGENIISLLSNNIDSSSNVSWYWSEDVIMENELYHLPGSDCQCYASGDYSEFIDLSDVIIEAFENANVEYNAKGLNLKFMGCSSSPYHQGGVLRECITVDSLTMESNMEFVYVNYLVEKLDNIIYMHVEYLGGLEIGKFSPAYNDEEIDFHSDFLINYVESKSEDLGIDLKLARVDYYISNSFLGSTSNDIFVGYSTETGFVGSGASSNIEGVFRGSDLLSAYNKDSLSYSIKLVIGVKKMPTIFFKFYEDVDSRGNPVVNYTLCEVYAFNDKITLDIIEEQYELFTEEFEIGDGNSLKYLGANVSKIGTNELVLFEEQVAEKVNNGIIYIKYIEIPAKVSLKINIVSDKVVYTDLANITEDDIIGTANLELDGGIEFTYETIKNSVDTFISTIDTGDTEYRVCYYELNKKLVDGLIVEDSVCHVVLMNKSVINDLTFFVNSRTELTVNDITFLLQKNAGIVGFVPSITRNDLAGKINTPGLYEVDVLCVNSKLGMEYKYTYTIKVVEDVKFNYIYNKVISIGESIEYTQDELITDLQTVEFIEKGTQCVVGSDYFTSKKADGEYTLQISTTNSSGKLVVEEFKLIVSDELFSFDDPVEEDSSFNILDFVKENGLYIILGLVGLIFVVSIFKKRR